MIAANGNRENMSLNEYGSPYECNKAMLRIPSSFAHRCVTPGIMGLVDCSSDDSMCMPVNCSNWTRNTQYRSSPDPNCG